ncbi:hypothetical protein [Poseidonocella sedimentorum]|uniref:LexA-binding, inner membrane-associated hydrolase n=1 Tax=Poseidonocella sedimentorum TaxID=871652 RepID=A0A1I6D4C1_9RHOB|nr:hypothetical protein [Poseidonocella sedimentorum]SFR00157.1 hypothetical protein SAMN04515673_10299 [Poseidonocella sedimentorum]
MALALAVLGRDSRGQGGPAAVGAIVLGALLPDLFLFVGHFLRGTSAAWSPALPVLVAAFNSLPLWGVVFLGTRALRWRLPALVAGAALLHILTDLPLHAADARPHFFPLTDWAFHSPVSFWDAAHHGQWAGLLEGVLFAGCIAVMWRRWRSLPARLALALFAVIYGATFVHFLGHAFAGQHWALW